MRKILLPLIATFGAVLSTSAIPSTVAQSSTREVLSQKTRDADGTYGREISATLNATSSIDLIPLRPI